MPILSDRFLGLDIFKFQLNSVLVNRIWLYGQNQLTLDASFRQTQSYPALSPSDLDRCVQEDHTRISSTKTRDSSLTRQRAKFLCY